MRSVFKILFIGIRFSVFAIALLILDGCAGNAGKELDTPNSGTINISVDESFKPIIDSEIEVFEALNPKAKIIAHYKSEADCLRDLATDTGTRMIIITRGLTEPLDLQKVMAVKNSQAVIDYVAEHNDAIGFVGVSWIGNKDDTTQLSFLKKVKIASVECTACGSDIFVKPYQANIMLKRYPFVRGLYYILKENYEGLGSGFANFMSLERGQLIFKRAYLGPQMDFTIRDATYSNDK